MRETIQNANGKQFHAVSLSGGKDSTAMLLLMIERDMPIDMVLSADTGMEFPEMYEHLAKLDEHLFRERGIHITTLTTLYRICQKAILALRQQSICRFLFLSLWENITASASSLTVRRFQMEHAG